MFTKLYHLIVWGGVVKASVSFTALRNYAEQQMMLEEGEYKIVSTN